MDKKPNVLLLMLDQLRWDCLGCYGNELVETPNLDWIAQKGTVFQNAYTPSPSCIPARACLISGLNTWHTGILGMGGGQGAMGTGFKQTLPGLFAQAGYHTQGVGKMHFSPQRALNGFHNTILDESGRAETADFVSDYKQWFNQNKPADLDISDHGISWNSWQARPYNLPEYLHPTNWTASQSIKFLQERDPTQPFFLMTSFARPHSPYDPPQYYFDMYYDQADQLPDPFIGDWAGRHDRPEDAASTDAWRGRRSKKEIRRARAGYYGSVTHLDHQIGKLLNFMRRNRLLDNTIVLVTSDHGDMLGDHNLWRKTYAYEGSAHIPLLVMLPQEKEQVVKPKTDAPVTLVDVLPTLLDLAGLVIPQGLDGSSQKEVICGQDGGRHDYVHLEHSTCYSQEQEMQCVTDGRHKYIWLPRIDEEQFFDLTRDPGELQNLAGLPEYAAQVGLWRQRLITELAKRDAGLVKDGRLVSLRGKPFLRSPHYKARLERAGLPVQH